jgi:hypothetical protein
VVSESLAEDGSPMSSPPSWLAEFVNSVATHVLPVADSAPLGCHYHLDDDGVWEVTLFAARKETVGGPQDGHVRPSRFRVDLLAVCAEFQTIHGVSWQAQRMGRRDELGPHVAVEGEFRGTTIWLRIPAAAPQQFPPCRSHVTNNHRSEEIW